MEHTVELPVTFRGEELSYTAVVQAWQYGLRFLVDIAGIIVTFERDDSGEFRALLPSGFNGKPPDKEVIAAIAAVLEAI